MKLCSDFGGIAGVVSLALNAASWVYGWLPGVVALPLAGAFGMLTVLGIVARVYVSNSQPIDTGSLFNGVPIPWRQPVDNLALVSPAQNAAPLTPRQSNPHLTEDVVQEKGEYFELKKLEPNFLEATFESLPAHNDENGIIVRGESADAEGFRAYVVPYSNYSNTRKIAPANKVSTRLTYICLVGDGPKYLQIERGAWLSEKDSELDFSVNSTPRRAIIAAVEGGQQSAFAIRREDSDYKGLMTVREPLHGEVFSVHVSILSDSRKVTAKNFVYILQIIREPTFEIRLTNAVVWKSHHLHSFVREGFTFSTKLHEVWKGAQEQVPLPPTPPPSIFSPLQTALMGESDKAEPFDYPNYLKHIRAVEREQEEKLIEEMKDWESRAADFIGLYVNADQRNQFINCEPSIENGFNRVRKPALRLAFDRGKGTTGSDNWTLSEAVNSRTDKLLQIIQQLS